MSLRVRFGLLIGGVVVLAVVVHLVALLTSESRHLSRRAEEAHWTAAQHLAQVCGESTINRDDLAALNFLKELSLSKDLVEAMCLDKKGGIRLHRNMSMVGRPLVRVLPAAPQKEESLIEGRNLWIYTVPVQRQGVSLGAARVLINPKETQKQVQAQLAQVVTRSLRMSGVTLLVALLFSWLAARALTRPILKMAKEADRLARGDWTARVPEDAPGELGELSREFNVMSQKLGELDALKDQVMHSVSHDLRNPLGAMTTLARMMKADALPPASQAYAEAIETTAIRLAAMLNNILDTARLKDGPLAYNRVSVSPEKLFLDLDRLYRPLADQSHKTLTWDAPPGLPAVFVDEEKIFRVMLNLLTNAFKFTREGDRIAVSARLVGEDRLEMSVSDTGWGISPDQMARLFVPYRATRGGEGEAKKNQGTGLGLSIVKALVEGHGGTVRVKSVLNGGTTMILTLPIWGEATP
jgi:signal transduction histidine kinase